MENETTIALRTVKDLVVKSRQASRRREGPAKEHGQNVTAAYELGRIHCANFIVKVIEAQLKLWEVLESDVPEPPKPAPRPVPSPSKAG